MCVYVGICCCGFGAQPHSWLDLQVKTASVVPIKLRWEKPQPESAPDWALVAGKDKSWVSVSTGFLWSLKNLHVPMVNFLTSLYLVFLPKAWTKCTAFCLHNLSSPTGWTGPLLNGKYVKSFLLESFVSVAELAAAVSMLYLQFLWSTFLLLGKMQSLKASCA